jgi:hypothetical protein
MTSFKESPVVNEYVSVLQKRKLPLNSVFMVFLLIHGLHSAIGGNSLQCWDNCTRGLDSTAALEFVQILRTSTELTGATAIVTVYLRCKSRYSSIITILTFEGFR